MRLLTNAEAIANLEACYWLSYYQSGGSTSMKVETLQRFADTGALIIPTLVDDIDPNKEIPDWLPLGGNIPFIPRAYLVCFIVNQKGYDDACNGAALADLTPWCTGDGAAYIIIVTIISQVRNGVARLVVAFGERAESHPAFPYVKEVMWYTRTAKGVAMSQYFEGQETGRQITRTFANGKTQSMPIYTLTVADWRKHAENVVGKLIDIEANFSDTLAEVHKKLKEGL